MFPKWFKYGLKAQKLIAQGIARKQYALKGQKLCKRLGITVFQPRLKVCTFARTNYYEYGKQRQVQESP